MEPRFRMNINIWEPQGISLPKKHKMDFYIGDQTAS